jgi:hypothetical protein
VKLFFRKERKNFGKCNILAQISLFLATITKSCTLMNVFYKDISITNGKTMVTFSSRKSSRKVPEALLALSLNTPTVPHQIQQCSLKMLLMELFVPLSTWLSKWMVDNETI